MSKTHDLDFSFVRENSDFTAVLTHYGIEPTGSLPQLKALCPFHDDTKPSLAVNTEKNIFNCFACDAKGNILDFVMLKDDLKPRPAGIKLAEICGIPQTSGGKVNGNNSRQQRSAPAVTNARDDTSEQAEPVAADDDADEDLPAVNKPLGLETFR